MKRLLSCKYRVFMLTFLFATPACLFLNPFTVLAQDAAQKEAAPLHVTSDTMTAQKNSSLVEFSGNVVARRDNETIHADSIKVFFAESGNGENTQKKIEKMVASGNVTYTAGEREAFADKAVYTADDQVLVLTGDLPKVKTGDSYVTGKKITLFRNKDKVIVEGGIDNKVNALFHPNANEL